MNRLRAMGRARWAILGLCLAVTAPGVASAAQAVSAALIRLHDDLHLNDGQESAWRDYTTAISPDPQAQARHRAAQELLPLVPTPRRLALIEATMAHDAADFHRQGLAVTAFYGQLSPDQQRTFDRDTLPATSTDGAAPAP